MKANVYLDVDGCLVMNSAPARHAREFIKFVTDNYNTYWLSTHKANSLNYISRFFNDKDTLSLLANIKYKQWNTSKLEAIDLDKDFIIIEDQLLQFEIEELKRRGKLSSWIQINLKKRPDQLLEVIQQLKSS